MIIGHGRVSRNARQAGPAERARRPGGVRSLSIVLGPRVGPWMPSAENTGRLHPTRMTFIGFRTNVERWSLLRKRERWRPRESALLASSKRPSWRLGWSLRSATLEAVMEDHGPLSGRCCAQRQEAVDSRTARGNSATSGSRQSRTSLTSFSLAFQRSGSCGSSKPGDLTRSATDRVPCECLAAQIANLV
jgi:hypothetical protein